MLIEWFSVNKELLLLLETVLLFFTCIVIVMLSFSLKKSQNLLQKGEENYSHELQQKEIIKAKNEQYLYYMKELKGQIELLQGKLEKERELFTKLSNEYVKIKTQFEEKQISFNEQVKSFEHSREKLSLEFQVLAEKIFNERGQHLTKQSHQTLNALLVPFREQIESFRQKTEVMHHEETILKSQLRAEIQQLQGLNQKMSEEAHNLTRALTGNKKIQGNWGELILENILERAGLIQNRDFTKQVSLMSDEGTKQIPDIVINLPDKKHLIVDAKVSLNAYVRFINMENDKEGQEKSIKEHCEAISWHIKSLSQRYYHKANGVNSPEIVIMFIPIESAFIEAFKNDEHLFQKAIEQNILVATPTTLLASLNIVRQLWRLEKQTESTLKLTELAGKVYDKLRIFVGSMDEIEKGLDKALSSYQVAKNQLVEGRGNLIKLSDDFLELGIAVKEEINEKIRAQGQLELTTGTESS